MNRMAAIMAFTTRYGCDAGIAAKAALALHPLDDAPVPSRAFEKASRKRSRQFARAVKSLAGQPQQIETESRAALAEYKRLAEQHGPAYTQRYDNALT
ncbi:hypothetical protein BH23ACT4_BH23ACT4_14910 [soil metagenome]